MSLKETVPGLIRVKNTFKDFLLKDHFPVIIAIILFFNISFDVDQSRYIMPPSFWVVVPYFNLLYSSVVFICAYGVTAKSIRYGNEKDSVYARLFCLSGAILPML